MAVNTRPDPTFPVLSQILPFPILTRMLPSRYSPGSHISGTHPDSTFSALAGIPPFFRYSPGSNIFWCLPGPFSGVCPDILIFSGIASRCYYLFRHYVQITHLPRHRDLFSLSPSIGATLFRYPSILGKGTKLLLIWVLH